MSPLLKLENLLERYGCQGEWVKLFWKKNCKPSFKSGRTSIGIWGIISGVEKGPLVVVDDGRLNQYWLAPAGLPFYKKIQRMQLGKEEVHWMEDGARYHN